MGTKSKYLSYEVPGGGKIRIHTGDKGEKFKIITLSAEKIQVMTAAKIEVGDSVSLKVQINSGYFEFDINSDGKIIEKAPFNNGIKYTIEFNGMSEIDKQEIDEYLRINRDIIDFN